MSGVATLQPPTYLDPLPAVTYRGLFPVIVQAQDDRAISKRIAVEGGSGTGHKVTQSYRVSKYNIYLTWPSKCRIYLTCHMTTK